MCEHAWGEVLPPAKSGPGNKPGEFSTSSLTNPARQNAIHSVANKNGNGGAFCACGAWLGCLGLEPTYDLYVEHMVAVFAEVWRVLRKDGTLWLNLGDCYATGAGAVGSAPGGGAQGERWARGPATNGRGEAQTSRRGGSEGKHGYAGAIDPVTQPNRMPQPHLKPKDLVGIPWRVALALQAWGCTACAKITTDST
jgi:hypothetical protein